MSMTSSMNKVYHTACCIIPPKELWAPIQEIRSRHDSAYNRWMPHVNLFFPFVHPNNFSVAHEELTKALANVEPFQVTLSEICHFDHGKKSVMWVKPNTPNNNEIQELLNTMLTVFPQCDDQLNKNEEKQYHPHLTLGQFSSREVSKKKSEFQSKWNTIQFTVNEISIISRADQSTPFKVDHVVKLGK
jgi:2'-5' RNA ligase